MVGWELGKFFGMMTTCTTAGATASTASSVTLLRRELSIEHRVNGIRFSGTRFADKTIFCKGRIDLLQMNLEFCLAVTVGVVVVT